MARRCIIPVAVLVAKLIDAADPESRLRLIDILGRFTRYTGDAYDTLCQLGTVETNIRVAVPCVTRMTMRTFLMSFLHGMVNGVLYDKTDPSSDAIVALVDRFINYATYDTRYEERVDQKGAVVWRSEFDTPPPASQQSGGWPADRPDWAQFRTQQTWLKAQHSVSGTEKIWTYVERAFPYSYKMVNTSPACTRAVLFTHGIQWNPAAVRRLLDFGNLWISDPFATGKKRFGNKTKHTLYLSTEQLAIFPPGIYRMLMTRDWHRFSKIIPPNFKGKLRVHAANKEYVWLLPIDLRSVAMTWPDGAKKSGTFSNPLGSLKGMGTATRSKVSGQSHAARHSKATGNTTVPVRKRVVSTIAIPAVPEVPKTVSKEAEVLTQYAESLHDVDDSFKQVFVGLMAKRKVSKEDQSVKRAKHN